jgi:dynein heavy chain
MITYHEVLKIVNPKRAIASEKTKELTVVMEKLSVARAKVKAIDDKLAALGAELASLEAKAKALLDEIEDCKKKLVRADKMISGLGGEKERWTRIVGELTVQSGLVTGDCLVAAGNLSYCGPFTSVYREELEALWRVKIAENGIKLSENITMSKTLGNEVTQRLWGIAGLPSDKLSIENGIIMF